MNQVATFGTFEPAYRQLRQSERVFVDGLVSFVEKEALRTSEPMAAILKGLRTDTFEPYELDMLGRVHVRTAIYDRVREISEISELNVYRTMKEVRAVAYSSMGHYLTLDDFGMPSFDLRKCTPEQLSAIKTIKYRVTATGKIEFEIVLHDKLVAIDKVMRYQGLLESDNDHWARTQRKSNAFATELDANVTDDQASEEWAKFLHG